MKAKKIIAIVVLVAFGASAQAQIVSSRSDQVIVTQTPKVEKPKKPRTFKWNIRAGYSFDSMTGVHGLSGAPGVDASFGISKPFRNSDLFWGVEAGVMSHGVRIEDSKAARSYVADLIPHIGIKIPFAKDIALNIYGGPYIGYTFAYDKIYIYVKDLSLDIDDGNDIGINLGVELFVSKNLFFDLHVKKGFMSSAISHLYDDGYYTDDKDLFPLKIVLGIGVQF